MRSPRPRTRWHAATVALAVGLTALVAPGVAAAPGADAGPKTYVALGDSFASAPLVPPQVEQPWGCLRSNLNYAHQVASELGLALTDMTCSGAQTDDMWEPQGVSPEEELGQVGNPPQLDALRPDTDVVTLQIGGNDIGFLDLALTCGEGALTGPGCRQAVEAEKPFERIAATAPKIAAVLAEIVRRSPEAEIYVLGYPGIFKLGATASCPAMAVGETDAQYLRQVQEALNGMIRDVADADDDAYGDATTYVDVYAPSAGHTACDLPALRWVEPIVPLNAAAPVHPNLGGMTAIRDVLTDAVWPKGLPRRESPPALPAPPDPPFVA